jgi:hypothetical protein
MRFTEGEATMLRVMDKRTITVFHFMERNNIETGWRCQRKTPSLDFMPTPSFGIFIHSSALWKIYILV